MKVEFVESGKERLTLGGVGCGRVFTTKSVIPLKDDAERVYMKVSVGSVLDESYPVGERPIVNLSSGLVSFVSIDTIVYLVEGVFKVEV